MTKPQFPETEAQYWAWNDHAEKLIHRQMAQARGLLPTDPVLVFDEAWIIPNPSGLTPVPADSGSRAAANVKPTDERVAVPAAAAEL